MRTIKNHKKPQSPKQANLILIYFHLTQTQSLKSQAIRRISLVCLILQNKMMGLVNSKTVRIQILRMSTFKVSIKMDKANRQLIFKIYIKCIILMLTLQMTSLLH